METVAPPRFTRKWFGGIFFSCWGGLLLLKLALDAVGWQRGGVLYWLVAAPLFAGFVLAGAAWIGLGARELIKNRRLLWREAQAWALVGVAALALVSAIAGVQALLS